MRVDIYTVLHWGTPRTTHISPSLLPGGSVYTPRCGRVGEKEEGRREGEREGRREGGREGDRD